MDLTPYVDKLRRELAVAAEAGSDDARVLADRLTAPLESAMRLALLEALSAAAAEITLELAPGSVDVRLRGRDPDFLVNRPPTDRAFEDQQFDDGSFESAPRAASRPADADEGGMSRISLRVPEHLKPQIEEAASRERLSVNTWLVRAAAAAIEPSNRDRGSVRRNGWGRQSYTGWVR